MSLGNFVNPWEGTGILGNKAINENVLHRTTKTNNEVDDGIFTVFLYNSTPKRVDMYKLQSYVQGILKRMR